MASPRNGPGYGLFDPGREQTEPEDGAQRERSRSQLRAALALEDAGELQEAARMFEYVGEHAQAASLRLEHADTLRDEQQRLAVLREGCARNPATSDQGRALHRALGEALIRVAEGLDPGARRRALALEAAAALEVGDRPGLAGRLYERLGLLPRAARAYTEAGEIERLEAVHLILEGREELERAHKSLEREVEAAVQTGRRRLARELVLEHLRAAECSGVSPLSSLAQVLQDLDRRAIRGRALSLVVRDLGLSSTVPPASPTRSAPSAHILRVIGRPRLRIGRGPQCELSIQGTAISREHVELGLRGGESGTPSVVLRDLGSRSGSFFDGQALDPGADWPLIDPEAEAEPPPIDRFAPWPIELALGVAASFELLARPPTSGSGESSGQPIIPIIPTAPTALLREAGASGTPDTLARAWTLFAPLGGQLWLDPERPLPARIGFVGDHVELTADPDFRIELDGVPVGPGVTIELLTHDRIRLIRAYGDGGSSPGDLEIEVRGLWS